MAIEDRELLERALERANAYILALQEVYDGSEKYLSNAAKNHNINRTELAIFITKQFKYYDPKDIYEIEASNPDFMDDYERLYRAIFGINFKDDVNIPIDIEEGLEYAISTLNEREQKVIRLRFFEERMILDQVGLELGNITRERVREIEAKALRKLRNPSKSKYFKEGYYKGIELEKIKAKMIEFERSNAVELAKKAFEAKVNEIKNKDTDPASSIYEIGIDELELSVRSYACLRRAGYNTLGDFKDKTANDLCKIRNLGANSLKEIMNKLAEYGIVPVSDPNGKYYSFIIKTMS